MNDVMRGSLLQTKLVQIQQHKWAHVYIWTEIKINNKTLQSLWKKGAARLQTLADPVRMFGCILF